MCFVNIISGSLPLGQRPPALSLVSSAHDAEVQLYSLRFHSRHTLPVLLVTFAVVILIHKKLTT